MTTRILLSSLASLAAVAMLVLPVPTRAHSAPTAPPADPPYAVAEDVVYGRRDGMALTMDVFTPARPNGIGVVVFVSAEYRSGRTVMAMFHPLASKPFLERGYTVFAAMHGSQPKYTLPEIVEDAHRAVRFVRHNARKYKIDPNKIGAAGASAGGQLALIVGCAGRPGNRGAVDPVDRESSKVAAVACFFPPTDFLALKGSCPPGIAAAFDIREFDPKSGKFERVTAVRLQQIGHELSPLTHAGQGAAPTFIMHGDEDKLIPITQSRAMVAKLTSCGVSSELAVKEGKGHYWLGIDKDVPALVGWFDRYLRAKK